MNTEQVLSWLRELKNSWLPENIPNDSRLLNLLDDKLSELERLLTGNTQDESGLATVDKYPSEHSSDIEEIAVPTHHASEGSLPTPPHVHSHGNENEEKLHRPIIRIKRIPLAEAALFLPDDWEPPSVKSKRGRKKKGRKSPWTPSPRANGARKGGRRAKVPLPPALTESITETSINVRKSTRTKKPARHAIPSDATSIPSTNGDKKKGRRKLRAMEGEDDDLYTLGNLSQDDQTNGDINCEQIPRFIGQNGLLSQTRRVNETTTMCAFDDEYMLRPTSDPSPADDAPSSEPTDIDTHQIMPDTAIAEPMNFLGGADCEQMLRDMVEAADNDSLFTSLELTRDKPFETSSTLHNNNSIDYNDGIEDISNDGIDPPPSSSSPALSQFQLTT